MEQETSPASDKYFKISRPELFVRKKTEDLAGEVSCLADDLFSFVKFWKLGKFCKFIRLLTQRQYSEETLG